MSHTAVPDTSSARPAQSGARLISPLLVVMVIVSGYGLVRSYSADLVEIRADGWGVFLGSGAIWLVYGIVVVTVITRLQRYALRPGWTIAVAVLLGAGTSYYAGAANSAVSLIIDTTGAPENSLWVFGPIIEETIKAVGVIALVLVPVLARMRPLDCLF